MDIESLSLDLKVNLDIIPSKLYHLPVEKNARLKTNWGRAHFKNFTPFKIDLHPVVFKDEQVLLQVFTHEVAHFMATYTNGHNHIWKSKHFSLGGNGQRIVDQWMKDRVGWQDKEPKIVGVCDRCGAERMGYRKTSRILIHSGCGGMVQ